MVELHYKSVKVSNSTYFYLLPSPKDKIIFITSPTLQNILSLVPLKKPILISNSVDARISHFLELYQPEQVFLLNLSDRIDGFEAYYVSSFQDVPLLFFNQTLGVYAGEDARKAKLASLLAALLDLPLVFDPNLALPGHDFSANSTDQLLELYIQALRTRDRNPNYLILARPDSLLDALVASQRSGLILWTTSMNSTLIQELIRSQVRKLSEEGLYINHTDYYLQGAYLLLLDDIPPVNLSDPVEMRFGLDDPLDGNSFPSDLEYGDLNKDGYLDVAVSRLPSDVTLASLMFARANLPCEKQALVASAYLHTNWFTILLYAGGGMWHGRNIVHTLRDQGYQVTRLVEQRSYLKDFLTSLKPSKVKEFVGEVKTLAKILKEFVGKTISSLFYKFVLILKVLNYAEKAFELYLEYDWSTIGLRWENVIPTAEIYLERLVQGKNITLEDAIYLVRLLWPRPWPQLTVDNLVTHIPNSTLIYYNGVGNGSAWIMPNELPRDRGFLDWKEFFARVYDGSNAFPPSYVPKTRALLVWDNSDMATRGEMMEQFLEAGTAAFIGATAVNYAPFSAELDGRFFKRGWTVGGALIQAVNDFKDDWFTWDPFAALSPGIKAKTLREFQLWGDPSLRKDPPIEDLDRLKVSCESTLCQLNVSWNISHRLVSQIMDGRNLTTLEVDAQDYLLEEFRPIIPLEKFEYYLPAGSQLLANSTELESVRYENITLPRLQLFSHSLLNLTNLTIEDEVYPPIPYKLLAVPSIDGRLRLKLILPIVRYNEVSKQAEVVTKAMLSLTYKVPIEFSIRAEDVVEGQPIQVEFDIWANLTRNVTIYVNIANGTHILSQEMQATLNPGSSHHVMVFDPQPIGKWQAEAWIFGSAIGPRYDTFSVKDTTPPTVRLHAFPTELSVKPGDELQLRAEVRDNDGLAASCTIRLGKQSVGELAQIDGWCNGSVVVPELEPRVYALNISIADLSGNVGFDDSHQILIEGFEALLQPVAFVAILAPEVELSECGNAICEQGEDCRICPQDCGPCPSQSICGDGVCDPSENTETCPEDCPLTPKLVPSLPEPIPTTGYAPMLPSPLLVGVVCCLLALFLLFRRVRS